MTLLRRIVFVVPFFIAPLWAGSRLTPAEAGKWREDIRYFAAEAPKTHKDLYHALPREQFEARIQKLLDRVPGRTREQVIVELARLVAAIGDGHTYVILWSPEAKFRSLPVRFYLFRDGLYVIAARSEHAAIVGGKVTRIGSRSAEEAMAAVKDLISCDNESGAREYLPAFLAMPEMLEALGIAASAEQVPITVLKDGKEVQAELPADSPLTSRRISWQPAEGWVSASATTPLWLRHTGDNFWSEYLPESKVMYVQFNSVYPMGDLTPGTFFQRAIEEAERKQAERFVVDVRLNSGGNNGFNLPIIHAFLRSDRFNQRGKLFTIIGRRTFSAAQNFVNQMQIHTETLFVGEPTGGRPNMFGDNVPVILPNSHLEVRLSALWWQEMDPRDTRPWRAPDIAVGMTFEDFRLGKDPVLEAALNYGSKPGLGDRVRAAVLKNDMDAARKAVQEFKTDPANEYMTAEEPLNDLGYALVGEHKLDPAIAVFKLMTDEFPRSANAWDSLAAAFMTQGNRDEAIRNYEKSLELNPRNGNARAMLQKLKAAAH